MYFINYLTFLYWCGFYTPFHSLPLYLLLIQGFEILQYFHSFFKSVWWQKIKFLHQLPWQSCHDNSEVSEFITNFFLGYIEIIYKFNLDQEFVIINSKKKTHESSRLLVSFNIQRTMFMFMCWNNIYSKILSKMRKVHHYHCKTSVLP